MDAPQVLKDRLLDLLSGSGDQLIYHYLTLWNNLLDVLSYRGLAQHPDYLYLRQRIPQLVGTDRFDLGYSPTDIRQFRELMRNYFIPKFVDAVYTLFQAATNVGDKSSWSEFNNVSLTECFTQFWGASVATQPRFDGQDRIADNIWIYWSPAGGEIDIGKPSGRKKELKTFGPNDIINVIRDKDGGKLVKNLSARISMIYLSLINHYQVSYALMVSVTKVKGADVEIARYFDHIFQHKQLQINPLTHVNHFEHQHYDYQAKDFKIAGGEIVCPRLGVYDPVVQYKGVRYGQLLLVQRENRGRFSSQIMQDEPFLRLVGGVDD